jgi:hypothetical protein
MLHFPGSLRWSVIQRVRRQVPGGRAARHRRARAPGPPLPTAPCPEPARRAGLGGRARVPAHSASCTPRPDWHQAAAPVAGPRATAALGLLPRAETLVRLGDRLAQRDLDFRPRLEPFPDLAGRPTQDVKQPDWGKGLSAFQGAASRTEARPVENDRVDHSIPIGQTVRGRAESFPFSATLANCRIDYIPAARAVPCALESESRGSRRDDARFQ